MRRLADGRGQPIFVAQYRSGFTGRGSAATILGYLFDLDLKPVISGFADQFFPGSLGIRMAEIGRVRGLFAGCLKLVAILFQKPVDTLVAPFVMGAGMHNDSPIDFPVKRDGAVIDPIVGNGPFGPVEKRSSGSRFQRSYPLNVPGCNRKSARIR